MTTINWSELELGGALGRDQDGGYHTASDTTACECGDDHRLDAGAHFDVQFDSGSLISWAQLDADYAEAHQGENRVSPERWRDYQAANAAALESSIIEGDAYRSVWPVHADRVNANLRFAVSSALGAVSRELGIERPAVSWFERGTDARELFAYCVHSSNRVFVWEGLPIELAGEAAAHEARHLFDGPDSDEQATRAFASAWRAARFDPNAAALAAAYVR